MSTSSPLEFTHHPPAAPAGPGPVRVADRPTRSTDHPVPWSRWAGERGQATAEYALVLLGAAAIALLLAAWAAQSGQIGRLFDAVVGQLIDRAG